MNILGEFQVDDIEDLIKEMHLHSLRMQRQILKTNLAIIEANIRISTSIIKQMVSAGHYNVKQEKDDGTE